MKNTIGIWQNDYLVIPLCNVDLCMWGFMDPEHGFVLKLVNADAPKALRIYVGREIWSLQGDEAISFAQALSLYYETIHAQK